MATAPFDAIASKRLQEYTDLEYLLLGDLRDLLEDSGDRFTRRWLVAVLDALLDLIPRQIDLKEVAGYLEEVLCEFPSWYRHVEELQNEQRLLLLSLQALRDRLDTSESYQSDADRVRVALRDWMIRQVAHRRHERRLLQTAINLDVGAGD